MRKQFSYFTLVLSKRFQCLLLDLNLRWLDVNLLGLMTTFGGRSFKFNLWLLFLIHDVQGVIVIDKDVTFIVVWY